MIINFALCLIDWIVTPKTTTGDEFTEMGGIIFIIVSLVVIFGMMIWVFIRNHHSLKSGKGLIKDVAPVIEQYATILEKNVVMEQTGTTKMPSHRLDYIVKFRFDNGTETSMCVMSEIFDDLPVGSRDILITQNNNFVDFGSRTAEDIVEDADSKN